MIDPIITFLNRVAYKFPKGYPDMNDPKDKKMLFEMVTNFIGESKAEDKATAIKIIKDKFKLGDEAFKDKGLNFHLLVPRQERQQMIDAIEALDGFGYNPQPSSFSSLGYLTYGDVKIAVKPSGIQGKKISWIRK